MAADGRHLATLSSRERDWLSHMPRWADGTGSEIEAKFDALLADRDEWIRRQQATAEQRDRAIVALETVPLPTSDRLGEWWDTARKAALNRG